MLGVASGTALGGLAEAYIFTVLPKHAASVRKELTESRQSAFRRWQAFRKRIDPVREQRP